MVLEREAKALYRESFSEDATAVFYSHGRLELLGNHTDHQGGVCLVSGVNLGITAAVKPNKDGAIRVVSKGYPTFLFHLDELFLREGEKGTTIALFKGVLSRMKELGYKIGGFSCAMRGDLPAGSGLSSSAAVEALICKIVDSLYNENKMKPLDMARISQYAENEFFGKPCGLLDQIGVCFGGVAYVDFKDNAVRVEHFPYCLRAEPVLVNTGGSHAGLDALYASIPADMFLVAKQMLGVERLSQSTKAEFLRHVSDPMIQINERAKLRAQHYFDEVERVEDARKAMQRSDCPSFLQDVRMSQFSSASFLNNTFVPGHYEHSPQEAVDLANRYIGQGAARIMGGGFAGSAICFVYPEDMDNFLNALSARYGKENVRRLSIEEGGPRRIS